MTEQTSTLTAADERILRTAAHGTVVLMAGANPGPISSTRSGMAGGIALTTATGLIGHVLAGKAKDLDLDGASTADVVDKVFPALTASLELLRAKAPGEVDNFRATIAMITEAAIRSHRGEPRVAEAEMARKIRQALDAA